MSIFSKLTMAAMGMAVATALALPANAQQYENGADDHSRPGESYAGGEFGAAQADAFATQGARGNYDNNDQARTGSQSRQETSKNSPILQGATNGTIGPQGQDATAIQGVNTAGTVRVNNLANLEALLNIIANGMEILGIAWGGPTMIMGFMHMAAGTHDAMKRVLFGAAGVTGGLATPGCINWLVASARDSNLFA
jgi:hypothetical protein